MSVFSNALFSFVAFVNASDVVNNGADGVLAGRDFSGRAAVGAAVRAQNRELAELQILPVSIRPSDEFVIYIYVKNYIVPSTEKVGSKTGERGS